MLLIMHKGIHMIPLIHSTQSTTTNRKCHKKTNKSCFHFTSLRNHKRYTIKKREKKECERTHTITLNIVKRAACMTFWPWNFRSISFPSQKGRRMLRLFLDFGSVLVFFLLLIVYANKYMRKISTNYLFIPQTNVRFFCIVVLYWSLPPPPPFTPFTSWACACALCKLCICKQSRNWS